MKKIPLLLILAIFAGVLTSCLGDDDDDINKKYKDWRTANVNWFDAQKDLKNADGSAFYTPVVAPFDKNSIVYMHWFNDTNETKMNLKPLYTSTIDVKYICRLYDNSVLDSSYYRTSPADSVLRIQLNTTVLGWGIGISRMHIGDSCRILIPYQLGYGDEGYSDVKPYTTLQFDVKLVGIPGMYVKP